jgi:hypothetical protein
MEGGVNMIACAIHCTNVCLSRCMGASIPKQRQRLSMACRIQNLQAVSYTKLRAEQKYHVGGRIYARRRSIVR